MANKIEKIFSILLFLYFAFTEISIVQCQEDYFPLQIGNKWIMESRDIWPNDTTYYHIYRVADTTSIEGKLYYEVNFNGTHLFREDSSGLFLEYLSDSEICIVDYNMRIGDTLRHPPTNFAQKSFTICLQRDTVYNILGFQSERLHFLLDDPYWIDEERELKLQKSVGPTYFWPSFHELPQRLKAVTLNSIVYGDTSISSVNEKQIIKINNFILRQNYPNPLNPKTTIHYELLKYSHVEIKIYNTAGQEVKTLIDKIQNAGRHSIEWNGKTNWGQLVVSGIYLLEMRAGDFCQVRKMTVQR